ncbi:MAG: cell division protein FtsA [Kiritimatiellaceae bacterium]|nr:cell division protein FtsA [Kiritimatiellaceae bacterium]
MPAPLITTLEIGTTTVKVLMGEVREDGGLMIAGVGESASNGVHKGEIIEFESALNAVRRAFEEAESNARRSIGESVYLAASGGRIESQLHRAEIPILNEFDEAGGEISSDDIEHVLEVARKAPLASDRTRMHSLQQDFEVDGRGGIINPEGMLAPDLKVGMLVIHGRSSTIDNLRKLANSVPVTCDDAAFSGFCSALAVLNPEQKRAGVVVIDLGGGTTDYVVYQGGLVKLAGSFAVGGDHVTADISTGLGINKQQAEKLKKESGSAMINSMEGERSYSIPAESGFGGRIVRSATLHTIINARMEETLQLVADKIEEAGLSGILSAGVVLTGGASALEGTVDLARQIFNTSAQIGHADCVGLSTKKEGARFATVIGAVRYAASQIDDDPQKRLTFREWFTSLWGGSHD